MLSYNNRASMHVRRIRERPAAGQVRKHAHLSLGDGTVANCIRSSLHMRQDVLQGRATSENVVGNGAETRGHATSGLAKTRSRRGRLRGGRAWEDPGTRETLRKWASRSLMTGDHALARARPACSLRRRQYRNCADTPGRGRRPPVRRASLGGPLRRPMSDSAWRD